MNVFIFGVNYDNKGSWAMALALESFLKEHYSSLSFSLCYDANLKATNSAIEENYDLLQAPLTFAGWVGLLVSCTLSKLTFGLWKGGAIVTSLRTTDLAIDLSGFALTDDFSKNSGTRRSTIMLIQALCVKILSQKYVLGPQAIGPFERPLNEMIVRQILRLSDQTFYRGQLRLSKSMHLKKVISSPDITSLKSFHELFTEGSISPKPFVLVNPNSRIYVKQGGKYVEEMNELLHELTRQGHSIILTPNEIRQEEFDDLDLCKQLKKASGSELISINVDLSLSNLIKLIDNSSFVIASRFHIMMFALARTKLVLVSSWSVKYRDLMSLYKQEEFCFERITELTEKVKTLRHDVDSQADRKASNEKVQVIVERTLKEHLISVL
jgi:polysaccharide pyruvyl transferase WcaK-like protein